MSNNLMSLHGEGLIVSLCTGLPETSSFLWEVTLIGEAVREDKDTCRSNLFENKSLTIFFPLLHYNNINK